MTFAHWLNWIIALLIVVAILTIGASLQEWLEWRKENRK